MTTRSRRVIKPKVYEDFVTDSEKKPKNIMKAKPAIVPSVVQSKVSKTKQSVQQPIQQPIQQPVPQPQQRTLDISKQDQADYSTIKNPFYQENFYIPDDLITKVYEGIITNYGDKLPVIFSEGILNLEAKKKEEPKNIVSLSKLEKGDYQTTKSKSDKNIAASIKFIINKTPEYRDQDNINFIVRDRRKIIVQLLFYYLYNKKTFSLPTFKTRIVAIMRIFLIAYGNKANIEYELLSYIIQLINDDIKDLEGENKLNEFEKNKFIDFNIILNKQEYLYNLYYSLADKNTKKAYEINQDLLLLSLYSLIAPLRNEPKTLDFTEKVQRNGDYIYIRDKDTIFLDLNEEKKRHAAITFNLSNDSPVLAKILYDSYKRYPREHVFTDRRNYPDVSKKALTSFLDDRLRYLFREYGVSVGVNVIRSSYVSHFYNDYVKRKKKVSYKEQQTLATKMRTSVEHLLLSYNKITNNEDVVVKEEDADIPKTVKEPVYKDTPTDTYDKVLDRNKKYYYANKEKILERHKKNKEKYKGLTYRYKVLKFLNNDPDYIDRVKQSTLDKYNIKYDADTGKYH